VSEQLKAPLGFPKGATVVSTSGVEHLVPLRRSGASLNHLTLMRKKIGERLLRQFAHLPVHPLIQWNGDDEQLTSDSALAVRGSGVVDDGDGCSEFHLIAPSFRASSAHLDAVLTHAIRMANPTAKPTQMKKSDMTLLSATLWQRSYGPHRYGVDNSQHPCPLAVAKGQRIGCSEC